MVFSHPLMKLANNLMLKPASNALYPHQIPTIKTHPTQTIKHSHHMQQLTTTIVVSA